MAALSLTGITIAATGALAVTSMGVPPRGVLPGVSISATATLGANLIIGTTHRMEPVALAATAKLSVRLNITPRTNAAPIRDAIQDVLAMWGQGCCTEAPDDCPLAEAVRCVNQGLQQFYQSTKAHEFLVVTKEVRYSWSPTNENAYKMFSLTGVDLPSPLATDDTSGNTTRHFQHVSRVTYTYTPAGSTDMRTVLLRCVQSSGQAAAYAGLDTVLPGSTMLEWFDTPSSDVPLLYEVFRGEDKHPKIRGWPFRTRTGNEFATVTYFEAAAPVNPVDYTNAASFDIAPQYVELYLMPLCRHAALSSRYMDPRAAPQSKAIEDRYQEVLAFLGLADIQPSEVA